jgi:hypothetical protein
VTTAGRQWARPLRPEEGLNQGQEYEIDINVSSDCRWILSRSVFFRREHREHIEQYYTGH